MSQKTPRGHPVKCQHTSVTPVSRVNINLLPRTCKHSENNATGSWLICQCEKKMLRATFCFGWHPKVCVFRNPKLLGSTACLFQQRQCSVVKHSARTSGNFVGENRADRTKSSHTKYRLQLCEKSRASVEAFWQRTPPRDTGDDEMLLVGIDADVANRTAVFDDEAVDRPAVDMQSLIPQSIADDNPYLEGRKKLPIYAHRQEILDLIETNQVIVLSGATGECQSQSTA